MLNQSKPALVTNSTGIVGQQVVCQNYVTDGGKREWRKAGPDTAGWKKGGIVEVRENFECRCLTNDKSQVADMRDRKTDDILYQEKRWKRTEAQNIKGVF